MMQKSILIFNLHACAASCEPNALREHLLDMVVLSSRQCSGSLTSALLCPQVSIRRTWSCRPPRATPTAAARVTARPVKSRSSVAPGASKGPALRRSSDRRPEISPPGNGPERGGARPAARPLLPLSPKCFLFPCLRSSFLSIPLF